MNVLDARDYVTRQKSSGYRSYHIIVGYRVSCLDGEHDIRVEIQIRTMAMNFWSTIDHSLQYKYKTNIPDHIQARLSKASQAVVALDNEMSSVRDEIMDAQNSLLIQANLVSEILTVIQNLYHLANKREILKIQDEFYRVYEMNDMEQLSRFARELRKTRNMCKIIHFIHGNRIVDICFYTDIYTTCRTVEDYIFQILYKPAA